MASVCVPLGITLARTKTNLNGVCRVRVFATISPARSRVAMNLFAGETVANMTRRNARECAIQMVYALGFCDTTPQGLFDERLNAEFFSRLSGQDELFELPPDAEQAAYIRKLVSGVHEHQPELDAYIEKYAVGWQFGRLPRVSVSIMRVCMYEVLYMQDIPPKAAMNECVEIAKKYEPQEMVSFINGIIGSFFKGEAIL